jgi:MFS transporter, BCD family, chlorophyll transporter
MVWADPHIRRFFIFVMLTVIGTLAQDVLLEPYAALVLNMSVGQTTRLTAIWGAGTLLSMGAAGAWLINRLRIYTRGKRVGLLLGMIIFLGLILAGAGSSSQQCHLPDLGVLPGRQHGVVGSRDALSGDRLHHPGTSGVADGRVGGGPQPGSGSWQPGQWGRG